MRKNLFMLAVICLVVLPSSSFGQKTDKMPPPLTKSVQKWKRTGHNLSIDFLNEDYTFSVLKNH